MQDTDESDHAGGVRGDPKEVGAPFEPAALTIGLAVRSDLGPMAAREPAACQQVGFPPNKPLRDDRRARLELVNDRVPSFDVTHSGFGHLK